jgi:hypothetical protein
MLPHFKNSNSNKDNFYVAMGGPITEKIKNVFQNYYHCFRSHQNLRTALGLQMTVWTAMGDHGHPWNQELIIPRPAVHGFAGRRTLLLPEAFVPAPGSP